MAERPPEGDSWEASKALADSIMDAMESLVLGHAKAIRAVREDQAEAREEIYALTQRVEALEGGKRGSRSYGRRG